MMQFYLQSFLIIHNMLSHGGENFSSIEFIIKNFYVIISNKNIHLYLKFLILK